MLLSIGSRGHSKLALDIPDEIWRQIQSRYAASVFAELFGLEMPIELKHPLRGYSDAERKHPHDDSDTFHTDVIVEDWEMLKAAIELTAQDSANQHGGQRICLVEPGKFTRTGYASISYDRLEIHIGEIVSYIEDAWRSAFRSKIEAKAWQSRRLFR